MIANKKLFYQGALLLIAFFIVFALVFMPFFKEGNALNYLDNLYNSISKASAYYIPKLQEENAEFQGKSVRAVLTFGSERQASETASLFQKSGASAAPEGEKLTVEGDLGAILANCLADADTMFHNQGEKITEKYQYPERQVMYNWWTAMERLDFQLKKQKEFDAAKFVGNVNKRAVETAYNYYKIEPQSIMEKLGIVIFSLIFYVFYTLWFGFSIMFLFEGWGMRLEH